MEAKEIKMRSIPEPVVDMVSTPSVKRRYLDFISSEEGARTYFDFRRLLYSKDDSLVRWLCRSILLALDLGRKRSVQILDVGGGDGERVSSVIDFLGDEFSLDCRLVFVEQSPAQYRRFLTAIEKYGDDNWVGHNERFERCYSRIGVGDFDLIFLIHSIFAFENKRAVEEVLALRSKNGKVVVLSNDRDSFLGGVKRLVDSGSEDGRYEVNDLERDLLELGIPYEKRTTLTHWSIPPADWESGLQPLLHWITLGAYNTMSVSKRDALRSFIQNNSSSSGGSMSFKEKEVALII